MRNFLGLRMDYPLGLPGIVYVFVLTPLFYAIAHMVFFSEGVRALFLRGDAFANSLIVIGRILAVIMVAGMSMYTLLFALVALGTLGFACYSVCISRGFYWRLGRSYSWLPRACCGGIIILNRRRIMVPKSDGAFGSPRSAGQTAAGSAHELARRDAGGGK